MMSEPGPPLPCNGTPSSPGVFGGNGGGRLGNATATLRLPVVATRAWTDGRATWESLCGVESTVITCGGMLPNGKTVSMPQTVPARVLPLVTQTCVALSSTWPE